MSVFIVDSKEWRNCVYEDSRRRIKDLVAAGAISIDVEEALQAEFSEVDTVISFVHPPGTQFKVKPERHFLFTNDEAATSATEAYGRQIKRCREHSIKGGVIVTYANKEHLKCLQGAGLHAIHYPHPLPGHRRRQQKTPGKVLISGDQTYSTYPTRVLAAAALLPAGLTHFLEHPGTELNRASHQFTGDKYLELLDSYHMGTVCRAGYRDRLLAKYVEFGACHVLPVGDCPSYMPQGLKDLVVDTTKMNPHEIREEVKRLFFKAEEELQQRQQRYHDLCAEFYDGKGLAVRVVKEVTQ